MLPRQAIGNSRVLYSKDNHVLAGATNDALVLAAVACPGKYFTATAGTLAAINPEARLAAR
jgi:hypothetical protein